MKATSWGQEWKRHRKKPSCLRTKADSLEIKIQDVQGTANRTRGGPLLKTAEVAKAMANRIKEGPK